MAASSRTRPGARAPQAASGPRRERDRVEISEAGAPSPESTGRVATRGRSGDPTSSASRVPRERVAVLHAAAVARRGFVLYWMTSQRRLQHNFALQRACEWAASLHAPLLIFEPLRIDYPHACVRHHSFIIDAMREHQRLAQAQGWSYLPYVEPELGHSGGLLAALAKLARLVVTDDTPGFFQQRMAQRVAPRLGCYVEAVDSNGVMPLRSYERAFPTAVLLRRALQKRVLEDFPRFPDVIPSAGRAPQGDVELPPALERRFTSSRSLVARAHADRIAVLEDMGLDGRVGAGERRGGAQEARNFLQRFIHEGLNRYAEGRNHPDDPVASGLSAWLHMGHLSAHEVFTSVMATQQWEPSRLLAEPRGQREGFWGTAPSHESFLNQLLVWRELALNTAQYLPDHASFASLPTWARDTLGAHAGDPRPWCYELDQLDAAATHDEIWNAAQRQLVAEGVMHNYLRMLWGKKILEWSPDPATAFQRALWLNDRYALDGRDANSVAGVAWVFGRYDRPWAPTRPIYGSVRYMSSDNTRKKLHLKGFLRQWSGGGSAPSSPQQASLLP